MEGGVEAELGDGHGGIDVAFSGWSVSARPGYHVFAFETAAVDAAGEGAGAVPRRVEDVVAALKLGG